VPALKQQQDTIATLIELSRLGVPPQRLKLVFNMVEPGTPIDESFHLLLDFLAEEPLAEANKACRIRSNDIYALIRGTNADLHSLASDLTNYKAQIIRSTNIEEKIVLGHKLAARRLALGVVPEHDACFAALNLVEVPIPDEFGEPDLFSTAPEHVA
jgi:hypothetical protein